MDIATPEKEDSFELARELLIAISESVPDKRLNSTSANRNSTKLAYKNSIKSAYKNSIKSNGIAVTEKNKADKLRLELISISYVQSPDKIVLP